MRPKYPSDLTDPQWKFIKTELPLARSGGRPRTTNIRAVVNAILYLHHAGCPWRYLPPNFPPWKTIYDYFRKWAQLGVWQKLVHGLHMYARLKVGRSSCPHLGIVDSSSVKAYRGEEIGVDGFKKIKGRKRHILVDVLGIILDCKVSSANTPDADGGIKILERLNKNFKESLETILGDSQYSARFWGEAIGIYKIKVETPEKTKPGHLRANSNLYPKRWIVERTFAWLSNYRRLVRDYERKVIHSESMLYIAMLPILLGRLCQ